MISVNPTTQAKPYRVEHEESKFDMAVLERALERATQRTVDRVIDELGQDLQVEEVGEVLPGQIVIDIRHPDAQEDEPWPWKASKSRRCRSTRSTAASRNWTPTASTSCIATKG